ncbi:MAG: ATP-binding cassette domain-containing protein [Anaerocolumna sp.]
MIELSINNLLKYYGGNKIFETITFDVKTGERIGLIGKNGCGKTTIMKIIMGRYTDNTSVFRGGRPDTGEILTSGSPYTSVIAEDFQGGEINLRKDIKVGYLNQIPIYSEDTITLDVIRMAFEKIFYIKNQMEEVESMLKTLSGSALDKAVQNYGRLTEHYELAGGYELETQKNNGRA